MVYRGHIKNGIVVLENDARLPEGTVVEVFPVSKGEKISDFARSLLELAGQAEGLPSDLAQQHDHYLYGTPKQ